MSHETTIARVRAALGTRNGAGSPRARAVAERLAHPPLHARPSFARTEGAAREARLIACLESQGTDVIAIDDLALLPSAIEGFLGRIDPVPHLVVGDDERLSTLAWPGTIAPVVWSPGQALGDGTAALTHAWGAVAETGTLVLASSTASPASLAFLPEVHIVALAREDVAASFEDAFARLGRASAPHRLPRAVNLVSGASRTGDIGGKIVKGAHGPRRLAVVLYGPPVDSTKDVRAP